MPSPFYFVWAGVKGVALVLPKGGIGNKFTCGPGYFLL